MALAVLDYAWMPLSSGMAPKDFRNEMMPFWIATICLLSTAWLVRRFVMEDRSSRMLCLLALGGLLLLVPGTAQPPAMAAMEGEGEGLDLSGTFYDSKGRKVSLVDDKSRVMFLNFWATWCGPCLQEMPAMAQLYERLGKEGLSMFAVTEEPREYVQRYLKDQSYPFTVLHDTKGELTRRLKVRGLPTTFILDKKRRVIYSQMGGASWDSPAVIDLFRDALSE